MTETAAIRFRRLCRRAEKALYLYAGAATHPELRDLMRELDRALKPKGRKQAK